VWFGDLPDTTREKLELHNHKLAVSDDIPF
jgi:hypothetical protein